MTALLLMVILYLGINTVLQMNKTATVLPC